MLLWNWLLPTLFNWPGDSKLLQGFGLLALCRILFGGFGKGGGGGGSFEKHIDDEDRERFRQRVRNRFCENGHPEDIVISGDADATKAAP